jgi:hypothetical protein
MSFPLPQVLRYAADAKRTPSRFVHTRCCFATKTCARQWCRLIIHTTTSTRMPSLPGLQYDLICVSGSVGRKWRTPQNRWVYVPQSPEWQAVVEVGILCGGALHSITMASGPLYAARIHDLHCDPAKRQALFVSCCAFFLNKFRRLTAAAPAIIETQQPSLTKYTPYDSAGEH